MVNLARNHQPQKHPDPHGLMLEIVHKIGIETKKPPTYLPNRSKAYVEFMKETGYSIAAAKDVYRELSAKSTAMLNMAAILEHSVREQYDIQDQLQDIKDRLERGELETKDQALTMVKALEAKAGTHKVLQDSVFKEARNNVDLQRNQILEKKIEMENANNMFNVALQLEGSFEQKTKQLSDILGKHVDVIDAAFEVFRIQERDNGKQLGADGQVSNDEQVKETD